ncbi:MAG: site-specific integrase [Mobilicoccus sp.]|nr:site-specific integrase [Mobilicoccus sp.]
MTRARLRVGEHGTIAFRPASNGGVVASTYYRNLSGTRRRLEATAQSKTAARRLLTEKLEEVVGVGAGVFSHTTTVTQLADSWFREFADLVEAGRRSPSTGAMYRRTIDVFITPRIGSLRLADLRPAVVDRFVRGVHADHGYASAKICRSVLSSVCSYGVRCDALQVNPVRELTPLESDRSAGARALTVDEVTDWLAILDGSEYAARRDLPDLTRFLLGTGCRIGEALALHWSDVDLDADTLTVRRTVFRVGGQGLVTKEPKTSSGTRTLRLPHWLTTLLHRRHEESVSDVVFPDDRGGYRDRNNVEREYRTVRAGTAFEWVVPHTYRKTVATRLDAAGLSARIIADQLGHSRISMTQDVYLGRRAVDTAAAAALEAQLRQTTEPQASCSHPSAQ